MSTKPPIPTDMHAPKPRIEIDTTDGSPFARVEYMGTSAANLWLSSDDGPYVAPLTPEGRAWVPASMVRFALREGLAYLLETGVIDIDTERLGEWERSGYPLGRECLRLSAEGYEQP